MPVRLHPDDRVVLDPDPVVTFRLGGSGLVCEDGVCALAPVEVRIAVAGETVDVHLRVAGKAIGGGGLVRHDPAGTAILGGLAAAIRADWARPRGLDAAAD